ncbi:MAG: hypothetical protein DWQ37_00365 [Planctomycetota bacterium]|nr:MAG: hypothetical protein DWQ37_00365 [Planctomycetota bacterium]
MSPVLLAALAVCQVPLYLPPQQALPDAAWPSHAVIAVPQGWIAPEHKLYLTEDGRPIPSQVEVAARWPDGSPKWLHGYATFRYAKGEARRYALARANELPPEASKSPLRVLDDERGIRIDTGAVRFHIPRPFVGIALLQRGEQTLLQGTGGPGVVDAEGTLWQAGHDDKAEIVVEQQGPACVTVKAVGWYQTPEPREDAFCRFTTRITAYAGSPIIKIDHATTFADDMKKHGVAALSFTFPLKDASQYSSGTSRGTFGDDLRAMSLAQLTDDRVYRIAQTGPNAKRDLKIAHDFERNAGWFSARTGDHRTVLLTRDFWQKCPKEVKISPSELVYYAWPEHGELTPPDPTATKIENVYKSLCFQSGDVLTSHLPDEYFQALEQQTDTTEAKAEYAQAANLQGVSMRNQFALAILPAQASDEQVAQLQRLYLQNPSARVSSTVIARSGAFGPVAAAGDDFVDGYDTAVRILLGYVRSIERYGDYGWGIYGNTHHEEFMSFEVGGKRVGRPSLHRVWHNNHYKYVSTAWKLWALHGDWRLLALARRATDNYASVGQVRYDRVWMNSDPNDPKRRPGIKYHYPGGFYHCKATVPWGGRDYGMDAVDIDANLTGHWPDPSALLLSWLLDADRWSKDGYDLWLSEVKFPDGNTREANESLVQAITAYEYRPNSETMAAIKKLAKSLTNQSILLNRPSPIWAPTWLSRYHELCPDDEEFKQYLVKSADEIGLNCEGICSLALCATAYDLTGDKDYLLRHGSTVVRTKRRLFQDPTRYWQDYGARPGPSRGGHFALQWPRFLYALRKAGIADLPVPEEPGQYLCSATRYDDPRDVLARGTRILILKDDQAAQPLTLDANAASSGDLPRTSLMLLNSAGATVWQRAELERGPRIERPSSRLAYHQQLPGPDTAGLYALFVGSNDIGIYQGIAGGVPECQVLHSRKQPGLSDSVVYRCKHTKGWLVPLVDLPITLKFIARSDRDGSYVSVTPHEGPGGSKWLVAGESAEVALDDYPAPWQLEIYGDDSSMTDVFVETDAQVPLLYGHSLEHVRVIQSKLQPQR